MAKVRELRIEWHVRAWLRPLSVAHVVFSFLFLLFAHQEAAEAGLCQHEFKASSVILYDDEV